MVNYSEKYGYVPDVEDIDGFIEMTARTVDQLLTRDVLLDCFSFMDLTTLKSEDTPSSVEVFVNKLGIYRSKYPSYPMPASVCVFSNLAHVVAQNRPDPNVHVTAVSACFPTSQTFLDVKIKECEMAVQDGADEIDIVLALNSFMDGDYASTSSEITRIKEAIDARAAETGRSVLLKVILETGVLSSPERIAAASFLAMEAGADFIKTSTGKVSVNATPMSAYVMCRCIKSYYEKTGRKVGFKAAGGISTSKDAVSYYSIVSSVLGKDWLNKDLFRLGVSRLANSLLSSVEQETVCLF